MSELLREELANPETEEMALHKLAKLGFFFMEPEELIPEETPEERELEDARAAHESALAEYEAAKAEFLKVRDAKKAFGWTHEPQSAHEALELATLEAALDQALVKCDALQDKEHAARDRLYMARRPAEAARAAAEESALADAKRRLLKPPLGAAT